MPEVTQWHHLANQFHVQLNIQQSQYQILQQAGRVQWADEELVGGELWGTGASPHLLPYQSQIKVI